MLAIPQRLRRCSRSRRCHVERGHARWVWHILQKSARFLEVATASTHQASPQSLMKLPSFPPANNIPRLPSTSHLGDTSNQHPVPHPQIHSATVIAFATTAAGALDLTTQPLPEASAISFRLESLPRYCCSGGLGLFWRWLLWVVHGSQLMRLLGGRCRHLVG